MDARTIGNDMNNDKLQEHQNFFRLLNDLNVARQERIAISEAWRKSIEQEENDKKLLVIEKYRTALEEIAKLEEKSEELTTNGWQPIRPEVKSGLIYAANIAKKALLMLMLVLCLAFPSFSQDPDSIKHFEAMPDRWQIIPPAGKFTVAPNWRDPYNQNKLKGDWPIIGQNIFFILTASTESNLTGVRLPTASGVSTGNPNGANFFGNGERFIAAEIARITFDLYQGGTSFRPRDFELKAMLAYNLNYATIREQNGVNINPGRGTARTDRQLAFQEISFEKHLVNLSPRYDFISAKFGIQPFASDFRRFIFADNNLGLRVFGNYSNNFWQYNLAAFYQLEKDTNSELNTVFRDRMQQVYIANLYRQDWPVLGFASQVSLHYNYDRASTYTDTNGFPARPALIGANTPHAVRTFYFGFTGDGHFGRWNVSHALYQAFGSDNNAQLPGRRININSQMAALEISFDRDWQRYLVSVFYASGDGAPLDGTGKGFDSILDAPAFAGGPFSFWNTQGIRLLGVNLVQRNSLIPNLRSSKFEGQANFVNPGLFLVNASYEAEVTPKLRAVANVNYLRFVTTAPLQLFLNQGNIRNDIGVDVGMGARWRPFLNNNAIALLSASVLLPGNGFADLFASKQMLFALQATVQFTY